WRHLIARRPPPHAPLAAPLTSRTAASPSAGRDASGGGPSFGPVRTHRRHRRARGAEKKCRGRDHRAPPFSDDLPTGQVFSSAEFRKPPRPPRPPPAVSGVRAAPPAEEPSHDQPFLDPQTVRPHPPDHPQGTAPVPPGR